MYTIKHEISDDMRQNDSYNLYYTTAEQRSYLMFQFPSLILLDEWLKPQRFKRNGTTLEAMPKE